MLGKQRLGLPQLGWHGTPGTPAGPIVKKTQRIEVPVDKYPNVCSNSSLFCGKGLWELTSEEFTVLQVMASRRYLGVLLLEGLPESLKSCQSRTSYTLTSRFFGKIYVFEQVPVGIYVS